MHATVVQQCVDDESVGVEAMPVAERLQRRGDRRIAPSREARIAAKQPRPLEMMSRLAYASEVSGARRPRAVKIFGEDSGLRLEEPSGHHAMELSGAGEKHRVAGGLEPRQHGLEEMHVRVLLAAAGVGGQDAVIAAGRRREVLIEDAQRRERGREKPRLRRELVSPGEPEQRESVGIEIALGVADGAVRVDGKDPARRTVGPMIAIDEPVGRLERDGLALRPPAEHRRVRKNVDLAALHHGAPRGRLDRRSLERQPLDEGAPRRIEANSAPERQRLID